MKRVVLIFSLFCLMAGGSKAQEVGFFDHMAAGVTFGTAGVGVELAAPMGPHFQLRAGYAMVPPVSYNRTFSVPEHPGNVVTGSGANVNVDVKATSNISNAELLVDFFPGDMGFFRLTAGALYGPGNIIKVKNTTPLPSDYNTTGLGVDTADNNYTVRAQNGYCDAYVGVNSIKPYVGIGFGSAVRPERKFYITFDLGVAYWGKPGLYALGEPLVGDWEYVKVTPDSLSGHDDGLLTKAEKVVVYPMMNLHLFFNLF